MEERGVSGGGGMLRSRSARGGGGKALSIQSAPLRVGAPLCGGTTSGRKDPLNPPAPCGVAQEAVRETPETAVGDGAGISIVAETDTGCLFGEPLRTLVCDELNLKRSSQTWL